MSPIRRIIYNFVEAECDAGEISEFLGMSIAQVKRHMAEVRNLIECKKRYHDKKAKAVAG